MTNIAVGVPTERSPELLGQTVVVIGGSAGIGLETARRARAEGAGVILTGRDSQRLERAAAELGARHTAVSDTNEPASLRVIFPRRPAPDRTFDGHRRRSPLRASS